MSEAFPLRSLISRRHLDEQRRLHAKPEGYGGKGDRHQNAVYRLLKETDSASVLDYGCGQGRLLGKGFLPADSPAYRLQSYDPAVERFSDPPTPADLVVCTDVLEHVEEHHVPHVLDHLKALTRKVLFVSVALTDTSKRLSDGRSAHVTLRPAVWWEEAFAVLFQPYRWDPDAHKVPLTAGPPKHWAALLTPRT